MTTLDFTLELFLKRDIGFLRNNGLRKRPKSKMFIGNDIENKGLNLRSLVHLSSKSAYSFLSKSLSWCYDIHPSHYNFLIPSPVHCFCCSYNKTSLNFPPNTNYFPSKTESMTVANTRAVSFPLLIQQEIRMTTKKSSVYKRTGGNYISNIIYFLLLCFAILLSENIQSSSGSPLQNQTIRNQESASENNLNGGRYSRKENQSESIFASAALNVDNDLHKHFIPVNLSRSGTGENSNKFNKITTKPTSMRLLSFKEKAQSMTNDLSHKTNFDKDAEISNNGGHFNDWDNVSESGDGRGDANGASINSSISSSGLCWFYDTLSLNEVEGMMKETVTDLPFSNEMFQSKNKSTLNKVMNPVGVFCNGTNDLESTLEQISENLVSQVISISITTSSITSLNLSLFHHFPRLQNLSVTYSNVTYVVGVCPTTLLSLNISFNNLRKLDRKVFLERQNIFYDEATSKEITNDKNYFNGHGSEGHVQADPVIEKMNGLERNITSDNISSFNLMSSVASKEKSEQDKSKKTNNKFGSKSSSNKQETSSSRNRISRGIAVSSVSLKNSGNLMNVNRVHATESSIFTNERDKRNSHGLSHVKESSEESASDEEDEINNELDTAEEIESDLEGEKMQETIRKDGERESRTLSGSVDEPLQLENVDLSHNKISEVPSTLLELSSLRSLRLSGNQLKCDFVWEKLAEWFMKSPDQDILEDGDDTFCGVVDDVRVFQFTVLGVLKAKKDLVETCRTVNKSTCDCGLYSLSKQTGHGYNLSHESPRGNVAIALKLDCSFRNLTELPPVPVQTWQLNVSGNSIKDLSPLKEEMYENLLILDADSNQIDTLDGLTATSFLDKYNYLSLQNNHFAEIPSNILSSLKNMRGQGITFLGANFIDCDCDVVKEIKPLLLENSKQIKDLKEVYCKNMKDHSRDSYMAVMNLQYTDLCYLDNNDESNELYLCLIIVAEVLLIVLIVGKVWHDQRTFRRTGILPWCSAKMPRLPCDAMLESVKEPPNFNRSSSTNVRSFACSSEQPTAQSISSHVQLREVRSNSGQSDKSSQISQMSSFPCSSRTSNV